MTPALVYFMKPKGKKGPIKIGCSYCPADRLEALSSWSPYPLEIIGTFSGTFKDEAFLHGCLADHHLHRGWFKAAPIVIETVQKVLSAGSLDAVRDELSPTGAIRKISSRKRTDDEKLRFSYSSRVRHCQDRVKRVQSDRYRAPDEVHKILDDWAGSRKRPSITPTPKQLEVIEQYLKDPLTLSVPRRWSRVMKESICIPVFGPEFAPPARSEAAAAARHDPLCPAAAAPQARVS